MLISMNWISDFVDLSGLDKEELIQRFTLSTAEVEEIIYKGSDIKGIVVGKILSVEKHPDSKKLHLLKVDGGDNVYDVVCGAPNVREGLVVPFAKVGAQLGEMNIAVATIAGYESHGMCCSEAELGISADHSGLMEITEDVAIGTDISELYPINDIVFEVDNKSLTNRPDLWGHYGIAREFAALTGRELLPLPLLDLSEYDSLDSIDIKIEDTDNCYRYSGLKVENVTKKVSPVEMKIRLFYCGTRAINLLADLTNYLMLEMAQPMHAFDSAKVDSILVKRFDKPFNFKTLDGEKRHIDENTLMITSKGEPVAIAGIMGGLDSEIEDNTTSLLLESANFDAVCVRKSSTRIGLRTDSSMRYEKTLDPEMTATAIKRFMKLLTEIDPDVRVVSKLTDEYVKRYPEIELSFSKSYVDRYTGIDISNDEILSTLNSLGFNARLDGEEFHVNVPSWRATKDVTIKADIIEEITRIYGYDNFEIKTTTSPLYPQKRSATNNADAFTKDLLVNKYSLHEVQSYIWCDNKKFPAIGIDVPKNVKLLNSTSADHDTMRKSIVPSLLVFASENKAFDTDFGMFEIARTVAGLRDDGKCDERKKLGIVLFSKTKTEKNLIYSALEMIRLIGSEQKRISFDIESAETDFNFQHPVNTSSISYGGKKLGFISTIHPNVLSKIDKKAAIVCAELDMGDFAEIPSGDIAYTEPSKYPGIDFDLSILVKKDTAFSTITDAWENVSEHLSDVKLVDIYSMSDANSITLRFSFSSSERTLVMDEVQPAIDTIIANLEKKDIYLKA